MQVRAITFGMLMLVAGIACAEEVKYYDRAPSVEELERQIGASQAQRVPRRTRAIVFGDEAPPVEPSASQPAAPTAIAASATTPSPAAPAPVSAPAPVPAPAAPVDAAPVAAAAAAPGRAPAAAPRSATIAFPINFSVNSAQIQSESKPFLESLAGLLQKDPALRIVIEGHTDISGNPGSNLKLSRERARSVLDYLVDQHGIDPVRLIYTGKGSDEPLDGEDPRSPRNRRVQFRIAG